MSAPTLEKPVPVKDIVIPQGADFRWMMCVIYRDGAGVAQVLDTAGWDVLMQVRAEALSSSPVLMEASTSNGRIVVGIQGTAPDEYNIEIKVSAAVTELLTDWGEGSYDVNVLLPNTDIDIICSGTACLKPATAWR